MFVNIEQYNIYRNEVKYLQISNNNVSLQCKRKLSQLNAFLTKINWSSPYIAVFLSNYCINALWTHQLLRDSGNPYSLWEKYTYK